MAVEDDAEDYFGDFLRAVLYSTRRAMGAYRH